MNAVRYYSKMGHTKAIAEAIAEGAGAKAISITEEKELQGPIDVLFLGGAPYANLMAPELSDYARRLTADQVKRVVLFTTSNWSRRTVLTLMKMLREKGIKVEDEFFYAHMLHIEGRLAAAKEFGKKFAQQ